MKIGILGGTFNPIHLGHLILAEEARERLELDKVIFVPTYLPPHKDATSIVAASARFEMIELAIRGNAAFGVSDSEIRRRGASYTIDTLREFQKEYRRDTLYFVIGSDLLTYLDGWKDLNEIVKMCTFIAATRPGYPLEKIPSNIQTMPIRAVDISGFEIRSRVGEGRSVRYLVPDAVHQYILERGLYR